MEDAYLVRNDEEGGFRWIMYVNGEPYGFFTYWIDAETVAAERGFNLVWRE